MKIVAQYSHLNGWEFIQVHKPKLWNQIKAVVAAVDANSSKTKVSKEQRTKGKLLYSPVEMNRRMKSEFTRHGWAQSRTSYWVTDDHRLIRKTMQMCRTHKRRKSRRRG